METARSHRWMSVVVWYTGNGLNHVSVAVIDTHTRTTRTPARKAFTKIFTTLPRKTTRNTSTPHEGSPSVPEALQLEHRLRAKATCCLDRRDEAFLRGRRRTASGGQKLYVMVSLAGVVAGSPKRFYLKRDCKHCKSLQFPTTATISSGRRRNGRS